MEQQSNNKDTNNPIDISDSSAHQEIRSALGMIEEEEDDDVDTNEIEQQQEDRDVIRQDNEQEFKQKRGIYEALLIIMCCLFLFSTSYSKATPKG